MCYYDMYRWECNDWKWGNFRQHCEKEYRMGETCGLKMVYNTLAKQGDCALCEKINAKKRKLAKAYDDYQRFAGDRQRQATAGVRMQECKDLQRGIKELEDGRAARINSVLNSRRADHHSRAGEVRPQNFHYG